MVHSTRSPAALRSCSQPNQGAGVLRQRPRSATGVCHEDGAVARGTPEVARASGLPHQARAHDRRRRLRVTADCRDVRLRPADRRWARSRWPLTPRVRARDRKADHRDIIQAPLLVGVALLCVGLAAVEIRVIEAKAKATKKSKMRAS